MCVISRDLMFWNNFNIHVFACSRLPVPTATIFFLLGVALVFSFAGCKDDKYDAKLNELARNEMKIYGGVPAPLRNPAGFCFESCRRQIVCRLGDPDGEEQEKIFETTVERCGHNCVEWIKSSPYEAAAQHLCYLKNRCSRLSACLSETKRLLRYSSEPEKQRDCFKLCVDYGACEGQERICLKLCNEGDLRIYRALENCENRSCPEIKECVEAELKKQNPKAFM